MLGFVEVETGQKPMSPPERGGIGDVTALRGLGNGLAVNQRLCLILQAILVMQPGQACSCQRIEGLAASRTAIPRFATCLPPAADIVAAAMRTAKARDPVVSNLRQQACAWHPAVSPQGSGARERFGRRGRSGSFHRIICFSQCQGLKCMPALCSVQTTDAGKPLCESRRVHGGSLRPDEAEASTYSSLPKVTNRICDNSDFL